MNVKLISGPMKPGKNGNGKRFFARNGGFEITDTNDTGIPGATTKKNK